ncbi:hypothetical protein RFI_40423 [Reticulomyxa filosa]|uniref:Uncharacterized protein n=1 Tax=Reticulomyxa filosa TaxID=46433 RepID=X6L8P4_RETFI|nr:hypothetical protein RFI_40423 [Reticulomyxa filosa]|eukprot:ETN97109.1 hypothetical protein RFI_40423 [Reticulomyxa filosa]
MWLSAIEFESCGAKHVSYATLAAWSFSMKKLMKLRWIVVILMQPTELFGFCCDVGKQSDGSNDNALDDEDDATPPPQAPLPKIKFKIGDYVKLSRGKAAVVKYIGETDLMKRNITSLELVHRTLDDAMTRCEERNILKQTYVVVISHEGPSFPSSDFVSSCKYTASRKGQSNQESFQIDRIYLFATSLIDRALTLNYVCLFCSKRIGIFAKRRSIFKIRSVPETIATDESDDKREDLVLNGVRKKKVNLTIFFFKRRIMLNFEIEKIDNTVYYYLSIVVEIEGRVGQINKTKFNNYVCIF